MSQKIKPFFLDTIRHSCPKTIFNQRQNQYWPCIAESCDQGTRICHYTCTGPSGGEVRYRQGIARGIGKDGINFQLTLKRYCYYSYF